MKRAVVGELRKAQAKNNKRRSSTFCHRLGIRVIANYILGLSNDTVEGVRRTIAYAKKLNTFAIQFTVTTPYPGTLLYESLKEHIVEEDWEKFNGWTNVYTHPTMTSEELHHLREEAYVSYHLRPRYIWRFLISTVSAGWPAEFCSLTVPMRKTQNCSHWRPCFTLRRELRALVEAASCLRPNMSHGDQAGHQQVIDLIRQISLERSLSTAILADLQGPKIRLGTFRGGEPVQLQANQRFVLTTQDVEGTSETASISYKALPQEVKPGERILVDDGLIELRVESVGTTEVITRAIFGGFLKDRKGVNFPDSQLSVPAVDRI
jgi:hypothetical protein